MQNDSALLINKIARERKLLGYDVTNGSIGMMYFDDGKLPRNTIIREILSSHIKDEDLIYSSIPGEVEFRKLFADWYFKDEFNQEDVNTLTTPGGTGALFSSIIEEHFRFDNNILLFPDIGWPNYFGIASSYHLNFKEYSLFDDELKFNIKGIISLVDTLIKEGKHVTLVINDPCHNPTGYSMNENEWNQLSSYITNNLKKDDMSLIIDCAYLDFAVETNKKHLVEAIKCVSNTIPVFICLSCSKAFSFYGLRCGELITIIKDKETLIDIQNRTLKIARGAWSNPNHMVVNTIIEVLSSTDGRRELTNEIRACKNVINNRSSIFLKEAKECNLKHYPYTEGFFITLICKDASKVAELLMKEDIYLSPISEHNLRVALCAIPTEKMNGLAFKISNAIKKSEEE